MSGDGGNNFVKELTLIVDVADNRRVSATSVIEEAEAICGDGNILAVVPRSGNLYEITVKHKQNSDDLSNMPFQVAGIRYKCHAVYATERVVSFLHLPAFIPDEDILEKLQGYGVEIMSSIKRRYYPGTTVSDGTRYVVVKFPATVSSLPYTMKFDLGNNKFEYIRVKHDNQSKVCSNCLSEDHLYVDCPKNKCYRCNELGHLSRYCPSEPCENCNKFPSKCACNFTNLRQSDGSNSAHDWFGAAHSSTNKGFMNKTPEQDEADYEKSNVNTTKIDAAPTADEVMKPNVNNKNDNTKVNEVTQSENDDNDDDDDEGDEDSSDDEDEDETIENEDQDDDTNMDTNDENVVDENTSDCKIEAGDVKVPTNSVNELNNNDNFALNNGGKMENNENGDCVNLITSESGVQVECTTLPEALNSEAVLSPDGTVEVEMDEQELAESMKKHGCKFRRNRINPRPNIPYEKRHSNATNKTTPQS